MSVKAVKERGNLFRAPNQLLVFTAKPQKQLERLVDVAELARRHLPEHPTDAPLVD